MQKYVVQRLVELVPVLFFLSIVVFAVVRLIPGDPASIRLGTDSRPEALAEIRAEMGLDKPLPVQYGVWLRDVTRGDLGKSWVSKQSVLGLIRLKLPATVMLTVAALTIALLIAIPAGIVAGAQPHSWLGMAVSTTSLLGLAIPSFWLGLMLQLLFAVRLGWLPPSGYVEPSTDPATALKHLILPSVTLGVALAAPLSRFMRSGMLDVLGSDYIRTARAKGLTERAVIVRHAIRNALLVVVTVLGLQFGALLGGAIVIERVFNWPGIGLLALTAINQRDYGIIQGVVLLAAVVLVTVNLLVDLLYAAIDPRIRY